MLRRDLPALFLGTVRRDGDFLEASWCCHSNVYLEQLVQVPRGRNNVWKILKDVIGVAKIPGISIEEKNHGKSEKGNKYRETAIDCFQTI